MIVHAVLVALAQMARGNDAAAAVAAARSADAARTLFTIAREQRWGVLLAKSDTAHSVIAAFRALTSLYRVDWAALPADLSGVDTTLAAVAKAASSKHRSALVAYDLGDDDIGVFVLMRASASVFVLRGKQAGLRTWIVGDVTKKAVTKKKKKKKKRKTTSTRKKVAR